jgi:hypothetical protein
MPRHQEWADVLTELSRQIDRGTVYDRDLPVVAGALHAVLMSVDRRTRRGDISATRLLQGVPSPPAHGSVDFEARPHEPDSSMDLVGRNSRETLVDMLVHDNAALAAARSSPT